jgi:hypothetical protein
MKTSAKKVGRKGTSDGFSYLTKRILVTKAKSAGRAAAKNAMEVMGYVVTVQDGWVVKQYQDGRVEQIQELQPA